MNTLTREEFALQIAQAILRYDVAINAGTGVGKTKIALDAVNFWMNSKEIKSLIKKPALLILVSERAHIKNWQNEISKWYNTWINNDYIEITIMCYASLKKAINTQFDIIICDEAHHLNTEIRLNYFSVFKPHRIIYLSATMKDDFISRIGFITHRGLHKFTMTLKEAVDVNVLPEPIVRIIPLQLDNTARRCKIVEMRGNGKNKKQCLYPDYKRVLFNSKDIELTVLCTEKEKYDYITSKIDYYKRMYENSGNKRYKRSWMFWGSQRKTFLGELKTQHVVKLLKTLEKKRYICFCTNIKQADILGGEYAIHSKTRNPIGKIDAFNNGDTSKIFAVGMLTEGVNLDKIEVGVIIQLDGQELKFIQKFGRTMRAKQPIEYILYFKDTRDEEYLQNVIKNVDNKYIEIITL